MIDPEQPLSRRAAREAEAASRRRPGKRTPSSESPPEPPTEVLGSVPVPAPMADPTELLNAAPLTSDEGGGPPPPPPKGIGAFVREHPGAVLTTALSVTFLLLGSGAIFAGIAVGSAQAAPAPVPIVTATPEPDPRPLPDTLAAPSRLRTCSVADVAADERLVDFFGSVVNASTGEVLWDRQAESGQRTGSVMKVLTAAAALSVLGPDHRLTTSVMAGSTPGTVVLVGGGDATLSRTLPGEESVYGGAPKLVDLAAQTAAAYAAANPEEPGITTLVLDATFWNPSDAWHPTWPSDTMAAGFQAPATALMVDGDRDNPGARTSPRSSDPIARAGEWFADALMAVGNPGGRPTITTGAAVGGTVLGQVQSQPVSTLIAQMLPNSDNMLGEMLARVTSKGMGLNGSTASLTQAITGALNTYGVSTAGITIKDGSGMATDNAVPALYMAQLFTVINTRERNLGIIMDALPVAGVSGTLGSRFTGPNAVARGNVTAKTGWIGTAYALSGVIRAADGSTLTFAFFSVRDRIPESAKAAQDTLAAAIFTCGDNLSNN